MGAGGSVDFDALSSLQKQQISFNIQSKYKTMSEQDSTEAELFKGLSE